MCGAWSFCWYEPNPTPYTLILTLTNPNPNQARKKAATAFRAGYCASGAYAGRREGGKAFV